jgi:CHAD domain-containing protein
MTRSNADAETIGRETPVVRAAVLDVTARLKRVRALSAHAAKGPAGAEEVHKLRVATRRAAAAIDLYAGVLPRKRARRMKKLLKRLRQAAGQVRDCDILLQHLARGSEGDFAELIDETRDGRREARRDLQQFHRRQIGGGRMKRKIRRLVRGTLQKAARHGHASARSFAEWAPAQLSPVADVFFRAASPRVDDPAELHEFRIRTKALRYAIEIVAPAFPHEFLDELSPIVERLQSLAGQIHDEAVLIEMLDRRFASNGRPAGQETTTGDPQIDGHLAAERSHLERLEQQFGQWWTDDRRAAFTAAVARFIPRTPAGAANSKRPAQPDKNDAATR